MNDNPGVVVRTRTCPSRSETAGPYNVSETAGEIILNNCLCIIRGNTSSTTPWSPFSRWRRLLRTVETPVPTRCKSYALPHFMHGGSKPPPYTNPVAPTKNTGGPRSRLRARVTKVCHANLSSDSHLDCHSPLSVSLRYPPLRVEIFLFHILVALITKSTPVWMCFERCFFVFDVL